LRARAPDLMIEGEMRVNFALNEEARNREFPGSRLSGAANLLVMPTLDAANIAFGLAKAVSDAVSVGPVLLGAAKPAHILSSSVTVRGILNMTALAAVDSGRAAAHST
jgi:malate dehydrogenase (oxaloacetate-decarboxylating)(NADP+)